MSIRNFIIELPEILDIFPGSIQRKYNLEVEFGNAIKASQQKQYKSQEYLEGLYCRLPFRTRWFLWYHNNTPQVALKYAQNGHFHRSIFKSIEIAEMEKQHEQMSTLASALSGESKQCLTIPFREDVIAEPPKSDSVELTEEQIKTLQGLDDTQLENLFLIYCKNENPDKARNRLNEILGEEMRRPDIHHWVHYIHSIVFSADFSRLKELPEEFRTEEFLRLLAEKYGESL